MVHNKVFQFFWIGLVLIILGSISSAIAAANTYSPTYAGNEISSITANQLKPSECANINLTNIVIGSGIIQGTNQNDLVLGSDTDDKINAKKGNDCLVMGNGNDELRGGNDDDVLLGGQGDDDLRGQNGTDICYGGEGNDTTDGTCETVYEVP